MKKLKTKLLSSLLLLSIATLTANSCINSETEVKDLPVLLNNGLNEPFNEEKKPNYQKRVNSILNRKQSKKNYIEPDYSESGTVITRPLDTLACEDESTWPYEIDSHLSIPVYYGKYIPGSGWDWVKDASSWSNWSPNNKRSNQSYYEYRGEKMVEWQVEERQEYRYCRDVQKPKYKTRYVTWFRGSKWWNCLISYCVYNDYHYVTAPENFTVIDRYSYSVFDGWYSEIERDYNWRTNALTLDCFGIGWRVWDSRTAYRCRSRWAKWSEQGYKGRENISLYHSLYKKDGSPIKRGIILESNLNLSGSFVSFDGSDKTDFYNTKCFYIPTSLISEKIINDIIINHTDSDHISTVAYTMITSTDFTLGKIFSYLAKKYTQTAVFKSFLRASWYFGLISLFLNAANYKFQMDKSFEIENFQNVLEFIDDYNLLSVSFSSKVPVGIPCVTMMPQHTLSAKLVDNKYTSSDDVDYISMNFLDNEIADSENYIPYRGFYDCTSYYGTISYMEDFSSFYETAEKFFTSFDIFDFTTWFS